MRKKVLGKGLEALLPHSGPEEIAADSASAVVDVDIEKFEMNPYQPRKSFNEEKLAQLSRSIKEDGVLQPVVVRRKGEKYQLIMGERRLQAAKLAGATSVPAIVKDARDVDSLRLALVENIQREDLNAIEVAHAYRALVGTFGLTQADLAELIGRDRSSVANVLRLLNLPEEIQEMIANGEISEGHARALLALPTRKEQLSLARRVIEKNLSVRRTETEAGIGTSKKNESEPDKKKKEKPAQITFLENALSNHLGTRVIISEKRGGAGKITIEFYGHDDFERLAELMQLPIPR